MPYKDLAKQRAFQNKWMQERRAAWIQSKGPCKCGSTTKLEMIMTGAGTGNHRIWGYSDKRRANILKRYSVACHKCAVRTKNEKMREERTGKPGDPMHLSHADVWAIRGRLLGKESVREIARAYGLTHKTVSFIKDGKIWSWLSPGRRQVHGVRAERKQASA